MPRLTRQLWLIAYAGEREWHPTWLAARKARLEMGRRHSTPMCDVQLTVYNVPRNSAGLCQWLTKELPRIK